MKISIGSLKKLVNEEFNDEQTSLNERETATPNVSDNLNRLIGFGTVWANIPRNIRLDVQRMVTGEDSDKIDVNNLKKALNVLGELDPDLDDAFIAYFAEHEGAGE